MTSRMRRRLVIAIGLAIAATVWWATLGVARLHGPVTSVFAASEVARGLLPWGEKNAVLIAVTAQMGGTLRSLTVEAMDYGFSSPRRKDLMYMVNLDNRRLLAWCATGEGMNYDAIRKTQPNAFAAIDLSAVKVDLQQALATAGENIASRFAGVADADVQIDANLGNAGNGLVWTVSYDAWTREGPRGYGHVSIDAATGKVVAVKFQPAVTQPS